MTSEKNENRSWFKRYGLLLVVGILIVGMYFLIKPLMAEKAKPRRNDTFTMVSLPPPPPPPPPIQQPTPPPVQQEMQEEKMIEQAPVTEDDIKPEPPAEQPPDLGTGIKGDGPADGFGLSARGNGVIGGRGGAANRSKWGWYAAEVQSSIHEALQKNKGTQRAPRLRVTVQVWPDNTGRITKAQLGESTGDPALDRAITEDVLTGLQLKTPPPQGMRMPINLRISARRPK